MYFYSTKRQFKTLVNSIPDKIVVLRLSSIGDIILASPLLRVLRSAAGKQARIDFVVKKQFAELVRSNNNLSVVFEVDEQKGFDGLQDLRRTLQAEGYGLVIDIHNNWRTRYLSMGIGAEEIVRINKRHWSRLQLVHLKRNTYPDQVHVVDRYIETVKKFGIINDGKGLELFIPDAVQFGISSRLASLRLNRYNRVVGLCPGAKHFTKRWPVERFADVGVAMAQNHGAKVLIFGGSDDALRGCAIVKRFEKEGLRDFVADLTGELTLMEVAAAMDFADVVISNDSGLMHIAMARQRKTVSIFGSTVEELGFFPYGPNASVLQRNDISCRPCSHIGKEECPEVHFRCMLDIPYIDVLSAAEELLAGNGKSQSQMP